MYCSFEIYEAQLGAQFLDPKPTKHFITWKKLLRKKIKSQFGEEEEFVS